MTVDDTGQSGALDVFGCPLAGIQLIEASAGTGKTWNICGLYLRLLLEKRLTVQQILVVTFTNAATAELRERVRSRIVDALAGLRTPPAPGQGDPFVADLLASQRARAGASDHTMALLLDRHCKPLTKPPSSPSTAFASGRWPTRHLPPTCRWCKTCCKTTACCGWRWCMTSGG